MQAAKTGVEVHKILVRDYAHNVGLDGLHNWIQRNFMTGQNPHDVAIAFVTDQVKHMNRNDPSHVRHAEIWVSAARKAVHDGRAENESYLAALLEFAWFKLGIGDPG